MPKVTINDDTLDAAAGDNLLTLARKNASHIWFLCDGRGLCQTCECKVHSGRENLSEPSKIELDAIPESRREEGYRLACQAKFVGPGPVDLISVAEEVRRKAVALVEDKEGKSLLGKSSELAGSLTRVALDFTRSIPSVAMHAIPQVISKPPDIPGIRRYIRDSRRVFERVLKDTKAIGT